MKSAVPDDCAYSSKCLDAPGFKAARLFKFVTDLSHRDFFFFNRMRRLPEPQAEIA
jgi:hypothetical protein